MAAPHLFLVSDTGHQEKKLGEEQIPGRCDLGLCVSWSTQITLKNDVWDRFSAFLLEPQMASLSEAGQRHTGIQERGTLPTTPQGLREKGNDAVAKVASELAPLMNVN